MDDIKLELRWIDKWWYQSTLKNSAMGQGLLNIPRSVLMPSHAGFNIDGPFGHREDFNNQDRDFGFILTFIPDPVKGTHPTPSLNHPPRFHVSLYDTYLSRDSSMVGVIIMCILWASCLKFISLCLRDIILICGFLVAKNILRCIKWILVLGLRWL